jgi:hypothetical protein
VPRLGKGEVAAGIKSKSDAIQQTIGRRVILFQALMVKRDPLTEEWNVFRTAQTLAEWKNEAEEIYPVSVKTLRKYVDLLYPGGLAALCLMAKKKMDFINSKTLSPTSANLKLKAERAVDSALEMTTLYLDLLERFKKVSMVSDVAELELSKHFRRYGRNPHVKEVL